MDKNICFDKRQVNLYAFLLLCLIIYLIFIVVKQKEKMSNIKLTRGLSQKELENKIQNLNDELYNCKIDKQTCNINLKQLQQIVIDKGTTQSAFLDKIYNPLAPPENVYSGGRYGYDSYQQYQMIGYLSGNNEQYPVFARDRFPGRSDKQEYYTINDSRNRVKIPFKTKNWNELFDGDTIDIPEIGTELVFRKYDTNQLRYDPNRL